MLNRKEEQGNDILCNITKTSKRTKKLDSVRNSLWNVKRQFKGILINVVRMNNDDDVSHLISCIITMKNCPVRSEQAVKDYLQYSVILCLHFAFI